MGADEAPRREGRRPRRGRPRRISISETTSSCTCKRLAVGAARSAKLAYAGAAAPARALTRVVGVTRRPILARFSSASAPAPPAAEPAGSREAALAHLLRTRLPAERVTVTDVSGGCGAFYRVAVVAAAFRGKPTIAQHRAVNAVLEAEIGKMHGLTLTTSAE